MFGSVNNANRKGFVFVGMGFELVGLILGALYAGEKIDAHFGTAGLGVAGLSVAVLGGWLYHLVVLLKRFTESSGSDRPGPS